MDSTSLRWCRTMVLAGSTLGRWCSDLAWKATCVRPSAVSAKETASLCSPASQGEQRAGAGSVGMGAKRETFDHRLRRYLCAALIPLLALLGASLPWTGNGSGRSSPRQRGPGRSSRASAALALTILILLEVAQVVWLLAAAPLTLPGLRPSVRVQASHSPSRAPWRDRTWPFLLGRRFGRPMVAHLVREITLERRAGTIWSAEG